MNPALLFNPPSQPHNSEPYSYLRQLLQQQTGVDLGADKQYLVETRLSSLLAREGLADLRALCHRLTVAQNRDLLHEVTSCLLTHETSFFRDPAVFADLRERLLPDLLDRRAGNRLRIWSAAASSGQELYSLAILLFEMALYPPPELLGTDVCPRILAAAEAATYSDLELARGIDCSLRQRYFSPEGKLWKVNASIRHMVRFEQLDLRQNLDWLGQFDLILCRNVLIYFDPATRWNILESLRDRLNPDGLLLLGGSESILDDMPGLQRQSEASGTYYRRLA